MAARLRYDGHSVEHEQKAGGRQGKEYISYRFSLMLGERGHPIVGRYSELREKYKGLAGKKGSAAPAFPDKFIGKGGDRLEANIARRGEGLRLFLESVTGVTGVSEVNEAGLESLGVPRDMIEDFVAAQAARLSKAKVVQREEEKLVQVIIYENQRCGGLSSALALESPSEAHYSATKLADYDPDQFSDEHGRRRMDPTNDPGPPHGWKFAGSWQQKEWQYNRNFFALDRDRWLDHMEVSFGKRSWVRRRQWVRGLERADGVMLSGWLSKQGGARSWQRRYFVLTATELSYYKLVNSDDKFEDVGAPLVQPAAARSGAVIKVESIQSAVVYPSRQSLKEGDQVQIFSDSQGKTWVEGTVKKIYPKDKGDEATEVQVVVAYFSTRGESMTKRVLLSQVRRLDGRLVLKTAEGEYSFAAADLSGAVKPRVNTVHPQPSIQVWAHRLRAARAGGNESLIEDEKDVEEDELVGEIDTAGQEDILQSRACQYRRGWDQRWYRGCVLLTQEALLVYGIHAECEPRRRGFYSLLEIRPLTIESCGCEKSTVSEVGDRCVSFVLNIPTATKAESMSLAFEHTDERDEFKESISAAIKVLPPRKKDHIHLVRGKGHLQLPTLAGPSELVVQTQGAKGSLTISGWGLLNPDSLLMFRTREEAVAHTEDPCKHKPFVVHYLRDWDTVEANLSGENEDSICVHYDLEEGDKNFEQRLLMSAATLDETERLLGTLETALYTYKREGDWKIRTSVGQRVLQSTAIDTEARRVIEGYCRRKREEAEKKEAAAQAEAEKQIALEKAEDCKDFQGRVKSIEELASKILQLDFTRYELVSQNTTGAEAGRQCTPALDDIMRLLVDVLRGTRTMANISADKMHAEYLFAAVVKKIQTEVDQHVQQVRAHYIDSTSEGIRTPTVDEQDHRTHLLAWVQNLCVLADKTDDLVEAFGMEDDSFSQDFFRIAQSCASAAQDMIWSDLRHMLLGRGGIERQGLFESLDEEKSPVRAVIEEMGKVFMGDLRLDLEGAAHSMRASRCLRRIAETILDNFVVCVFDILKEKCEGLGGLREFRFLVERDLEHLKRFEEDVSGELLGVCQGAIMNAGSSDTELVVMELSGHSSTSGDSSDDEKGPTKTGCGIILPKCPDDVRQFPIVAASVKSGSAARQAGVRKGDVILNLQSSTDLDRSGPAVLEVLQPSPELSHVVLKLRSAVVLWHSAWKLIDSIGSPTRFVSAYEEMVQIRPDCAYGLALATKDKAVMKLVASVDTSTLLERASLAHQILEPCPIQLASHSNFNTSWWQNQKGKPVTLMADSSACFITVVNKTERTLRCGKTHFLLPGSEWWQPPPSTIGPGKTMTWAAHSPGLIRSAGGGCVVFDINSGRDRSIAVGWTFPARTPIHAEAHGYVSGRKVIGKMHLAPAEIDSEEKTRALWEQRISARTARNWCHCAKASMQYQVRTLDSEGAGAGIDQCLFELSTMSDDEVARARDLNEVAARLRESKLIADRGTKHSQCFIGHDFIGWVIENQVLSITNRVDAVNLGQDMLDTGMIHQVLGHGFEDMAEVRKKAFIFKPERDYFKMIFVPYDEQRQKEGAVQIRMPGKTFASYHLALGGNIDVNPSHATRLDAFRRQYDATPVHSLDMTNVAKVRLEKDDSISGTVTSGLGVNTTEMIVVLEMKGDENTEHNAGKRSNWRSFSNGWVLRAATDEDARKWAEHLSDTNEKALRHSQMKLSDAAASEPEPEAEPEPKPKLEPEPEPEARMGASPPEGLPPSSSQSKSRGRSSTGEIRKKRGGFSCCGSRPEK